MPPGSKEAIALIAENTLIEFFQRWDIPTWMVCALAAGHTAPWIQEKLF